MSAAKRGRIGLAGAGWVSRHHLAAWAELSDVAEVVAIADPDIGRARAMAAEFGVSATYVTADAMIANERLNAIDIAASRAAHVALVRLAASHGLNVLCQKPLAPTFAEAEGLVRELTGKTRLMVQENWRFRGQYRQAAAWLRDGKIGEVRAAKLDLVTSSFCRDAEGRCALLEGQPFLRREPRLLLSEVLIHHLDTLRFLLGPMQVVAAATSRISSDIVGEDTALVQLRTARGASIALFGTFSAPGAPPQLVDMLDIFGTQGRIRLDGPRLSLEGQHTARIEYDLAKEYSASYAAAIGHFVECLSTGDPFETDPSNNLETLKLVEDCYRLAAA